MRYGGILLGFTSAGTMLLVAAILPTLAAPSAEPAPFTIQSASSVVGVGEAATDPLFDLSAASGDQVEACIRVVVAAKPGDDPRLFSTGVSDAEAADRIGIRVTRSDPVEHTGERAGVIPCEELGSPTIAMTRLGLSLADYAATRFSPPVGDSLGVADGSPVAVDLGISLTVAEGAGGFEDLVTGWIIGTG